MGSNLLIEITDVRPPTLFLVLFLAIDAVKRYCCAAAGLQVEELDF
jgi:hypothetical protein